MVAALEYVSRAQVLGMAVGCLAADDGISRVVSRR